MVLVLPRPATSTSSGPGYDRLGLALQLYNQPNRFTVEPGGHGSSTPSIEVRGELGAGRETGPDTLFFRFFALLFARRRVPVPAVRIRMEIACSPGSSATAVVGGLLAASEFLRIQDPGLVYIREDLLLPGGDDNGW